jgi:two-component system, chemotaxis family, response regulator WspF
MRIAIVNDMPMAVEVLRRVIKSIPKYEVAWVAYDGAEAVQKCARDLPDLVLMDLLMPVMDGVEATKQIMKNSPCPVLVVTATVTGNSSKVFDAMGHGALDAVNTPVLGASGKAEGASALLSKIGTIEKLIRREPTKSSFPATVKKSAPTAKAEFPLIAIGASTGGPLIIANILHSLSAELQAGIVVIQHVDVEFAEGLALWLDEQATLPVALAQDGSQLEAGKVLLAGTNDHLIVTNSLHLMYTSKPESYPYRPSADVFFKSVAEHWPGTAIGVLLTGMGKDGAEGLLAMRQAGWHTIAQDQKTSIVYGMPKAAAELNAAVEVLPADQIAEALTQALKRNQSKSIRAKSQGRDQEIRK